jgi:hypothetical protein
MKIAVLKARAKRLDLQVRLGSRNWWVGGGGGTRPGVGKEGLLVGRRRRRH